MKKTRKTNFKTLSAAILTGCAFVGFANVASATDLTDIDLSQKPVETPTLDYLKDNNVLIPQKSGYDSRFDIWIEGEPIESPGSAFTISKGTEADYTFEYKTADKNGTLTTNYYKVSLKRDNLTSELPSLSQDDIKWTKLETKPALGTPNIISIDVSDTETLYYSYEYTKPENYTVVQDKSISKSVTDPSGITVQNHYIFDSGAGLNNPKGSTTSIKNVLYKNNSSYGCMNFTTSMTYYADIYGGAIYNEGEITEIIGDFINNRVSGSSSIGIINAYGGAIYNDGNIGDINGNFIDNYAGTSGGAISNSDKINSITGNFVSNSAGSSGGAIYNGSGKIGKITGDFIGNSAKYSGGAIYNSAIIGNIVGDFINNSASFGGAIHNNDTIKNVKGNFVFNSAQHNGGAIYNDEVINAIFADFRNNRAEYGGAISNSIYGVIGGIIGSFVNNSAKNHGGAIYNTNKVGGITGDFIGNSAGNEGGAIYNSAIIGNIVGDFISNSAGNNGGAISNSYGSIVGIVGSFINNTTDGSGGAIYNHDYYRNLKTTIGDIVADFIGNSAKSYGGAIYNDSGTIGNISGDFIGNSAGIVGGAIYNVSGTIGNISGDFIGNSAKYNGGAIYNPFGTIGNITGDFINNNLLPDEGAASFGGAIYNSSSTIGNIIGDFKNNSAGGSTYGAFGGAIFNSGTISDLVGDYINNHAEVSSERWKYDGAAKGGAICNNSGNINKVLNSSFIGNYAKISIEKGIAQGGAIWTNTDLNIVADNGNSTFKGNYTDNKGVIDDNAIYVASNSAAINFETKNNGRIDMYDNIRGLDGYSVNITGDNTGVFGMYNDMYDANLSVGNTYLTTVNNLVHDYKVNNFTLTGNTNMIADVDIKNQEMDRFTANGYGEHNGTLNVIGMNLLSDAPDDREVTAIYFAQQGLKDHVSTTSLDLPQKEYQTTAYTPIYKYNVLYKTDYATEENGLEDGGYFLFTKGDRILTPGGGSSSTGNPSDAFNPAVLNAPISAQAGAQASMSETFRYVFEHADAFTQLPSVDRLSHIKANQYALSTDYNNNLGSLATEFNNKAGWFRPYVTFEDMDLKNGPKVSAKTYGSLFGFDSDFHELKNGWTSLTTGYIGYNGSQLHYPGVDTTMNGGLIGLTETFYKGNFWTALTLSAGASVGESNNMYGKEEFTSLMAGIGSKTGYNFEFKEGKYIVQPIMFMSYTFVNTFDYTNAAGVRINSDPMHSIQLNPSVRFIANTKNEWQPYASVGMVWNLLNESNVSANGVKLPEMSMKPYVEYGVGIQKRFKDKFIAFGQAMLRNGGRNGIALTAGFRWSLGDEGKAIKDRVQNDESRKIVKQLTQQQKMALTKPSSTTRTTARVVLKQL